MNKAERDKLRELATSAVNAAHNGSGLQIAQAYAAMHQELYADRFVALLDHVDALERQSKYRGTLIMRAIGWVEEVHCSGEGATQQQRSFINEMQAALASASEVK